MAPISTRLVVALVATVCMLPFGAAAQSLNNKHPGAAAAHPAPRGGGAPHPSFHAAGPRPSFHAAGPRPSFHAAGPRPSFHAATPHPSFHAASRPTFRAAPHIAVRRSAGPRIHAPTINRSVRRHDLRQRQRTITAAPAQQNITRQNIHNRRALRQAHPTQRTLSPTTTGALSPTTTGTIRGAHRGTRFNGQPRIGTDAARRGRFASSFAAADPNHRWSHLAARRAWHRGHRAGFVAWYGPVFWPYAYSDIFDYTFWPYGYDDSYWYYAYDDFFDGVFWGEYGPPVDYAYAPSAGSSRPRVTYAAVQELCREPGTGITAWPFAEIQRKVGLNGEQKDLLGDVRDAAKKAAATFKVSCPSDRAFPLTPPGRLQTMTARLQATLEAVEAVRPALDKFYNSLSDEQKERFNELGPKQGVNNAEAKQALPDEAKRCSEAKPGLTNLPIEQIEDAVKPNKEQEADLDKLGEATVKAVGVLQAACPQETPITPPGRLAAMATRLKAMIEAANTVKPPLDTFYASLSNEQKARFNRMGRELAQSNE